MARNDDRSQACVFGDLASDYAASRPTYPDALIDAVWTRLPDARPMPVTVDVAAGTGAATASLVARGGRVLAIEPSLPMLDHARMRLSGQCAWMGGVAARAEALPLRRETVGLLTVAQAFHWLDPERALEEFARILQPSGLLALFWNIPEENDFTNEVWELVEAMNPGHKRPVTIAMHDRPEALLAHRSFDAEPSIEIRWSRDLNVDDYIRYAFSWSYVGGALDGEARAVFESRLRRIVARHFGAGPVVDRISSVAQIATRRS